MVYDGLGRQIADYVGYYDGAGTDDPASLTDNVIFEQGETQYNAAGNMTMTTSRQRWHDATGTGRAERPQRTTAEVARQLFHHLVRRRGPYGGDG